MHKSKYSVDSQNSLIIRNGRNDLSVNGYFSIDESNRLIYWLNETSVWRKKYELPEKIVFTGHWKLDPNYDLELHLTQDTIAYQEEIIMLKGEIIACEKEALVFEIKSHNKEGLSQFRLLKLTGVWAVNELNQISFTIRKKDNPDTLIFQGTWQLNQNQQVVYTYEKTGLKTKNKCSYTLTFSGFWQITSAHRLTYIISQGTDSKFDFKAQIETPNLYPKDGVIKYRIGVGAKESKPEKTQIVSLYGTWKFSRELGFTFDMEYSKGQIYSFSFGAEANFDKNNQIIFNLTSKEREKLGMNLIFTHRFLKRFDAELFTRLKTSREESGIDVGIRIPF